MSRETMSWLNENTLIGFTEMRGNAWHHRAGSDNHYPGAVPVEDVRKRLFDWTAEEHYIHLGRKVNEQEVVGPFGNLVGDAIADRKAIVRSDNQAVLGVFGENYQPHQYEEWLVKNVETIIDDDLQIGTAGLLRGGGQAWVQVEVPETMEFAGGIKARPFLLAATSLDGSLSSTYGASATVTVCDNTMAVALGEHGGWRVKIRHSLKSLGRIQDVRDALGLIHAVGDDFDYQVRTLLAREVQEKQFLELLHGEVPLPDPKRAAGAYNTAVKKREFIFDLYRFDERVAPWSGTGMGALQAFNTDEQHESKIRKTTNRVERNAGRMVTGTQDKVDTSMIQKILELTA
jgi:phage/plasmid-like protein (TIGR03299 family)